MRIKIMFPVLRDNRESTTIWMPASCCTPPNPADYKIKSVFLKQESTFSNHPFLHLTWVMCWNHPYNHLNQKT